MELVYSRTKTIQEDKVSGFCPGCMHGTVIKLIGEVIDELGIIEKLSDFPPEQREMIESELSKRYFCPVITEIKSVREKFGNFYFDVMIGERKKNFTVKNITKNIRYHGSGFDIIDIDGNRYNIPDYSQISGKSRRNLDPYIY